MRDMQSARSLVGMSQSARKRAADDIAATKARREIDTYSDGEECFREFQESERAKYRIGERLRPCPSCEMWRRAGFKQESGRCPTCDQNSGLLPARKARKARR